MGWKEIAEAKRASILASIPEEWHIPTPPSADEQRDVTGSFIQQYLDGQEIEITESDATVIVGKAAQRQWSAEQITRAFCHRAAVAHQLVNCLHEVFFDDALTAAKDLDEYLAKNGKTKGPLHGLPVSLKDQFHVRNVETSMGYVGWLGTFEGEKGTGKERVFESEMVKELRQLGAVLYCKTSVPHTLMCGETTNNIIDYTYNPKNRNLSSGGSSGGEGALIGLRGSPVGFGTDIGGSIRIPAAFNGIFGLRPSTGRLPYEGMANSFDGAPGILSVVGPLAPSPSTLKLVTKSLLSTEPWLHDPLVHDMPWRADIEKSTTNLATSGQLCFGVLSHDGECAVHPPVARALKKVVNAVKAAGHKTVEWQTSKLHAKTSELSAKCFGFDGGRDAKKAFDLSGEPLKPEVQLGDFENPSPESSATDIMRTMVEKRRFCKDYMEHWNSTAETTGTGRPVDAIISPLAPFAAARRGLYTYYGYSFYVNVLDYTSVVVPVLTADKSIDKKDESYKPVSESDQKTYDTYDADVYDGAHVSIQLVGRRLQEEKMLALAEYIADILRQ